ncbi:MAG: MFS transporter [Betaproteobacteria bacterium]
MPGSPDVKPSRGLLVVMLAMAASSNVGFALGLLGPQLRADLEVSRTALGLLASAFFAASAAASVAAARLVQRIGPRRGIGYALATECVACVTAGLVGDYPLLFAAAVLAGASYAVVNVAGNRVVRALATDGRLGRAMTVKTAGVPVATTAVAVLGGVTTRWGWQPVVVGLGGAAGLIGIAAVRRLADIDRVAHSRSGGPPAPPDRLGTGFLLLPVTAFCFIAGSQPLYNWVPSYLHESLDVGVGTASVLTGVATAIGIPAMVGLGRLADVVGAAHRVRFLGGLCAAIATAIVLVLLAGVFGVGTAVVGLVVGVSANLALAGLFPALIVEYAPYALERGTGVAMTGYFFGALASPVGFGALADRSGGYTLPWLTCLALLATAALLCLLIAAVVRPMGAPEDTAGGTPLSSPAWDA